jgi:hypothetical protein
MWVEFTPRLVGLVKVRFVPLEALFPIFPPPIVTRVFACGVAVEACDSCPRTRLYKIRMEGSDAAMQPTPTSMQENRTMWPM